jgi:hypothetical protein
MPLFYDIQLFELNLFRASIIPASGNYKFDTTLSDFGLVKERKIRKINNKGSVLKLYNTKEEKSIYPMLQEFGYTTVDTFIFKSSWDINYHYITSVKSSSINPVANNEENLTIVNPISIGVQNPIKNINL